MERNYTILKRRAAAIIDRICEENHPIECHEGYERRKCNGDRIVDILLVYEDPDLVNDVITDAMTDELPFNF